MRQKNCIHCSGSLLGKKFCLFGSKNFWILCDGNPLIEGHILIIPKKHISCTAALDKSLFDQYKKLYHQVKIFIKENYGSVSVFEHGITGQTVFHAHTHFLPFKGNIDQVVADKDKYNQVDSLDDVKDEFNKQGKYLQVEVRNKIYLVDTAIGYPKFFRELFAKALGAPERADWRTARQDKNLDKLMDKGIENLKNKWKIY